MELISSKQFSRDLRAILKKNPKSGTKITSTLSRFKVDPSHPSLRLHKLSGTENYSISVDMKIRILFHKNHEQWHLLRIGTHEEVYE